MSNFHLHIICFVIFLAKVLPSIRMKRTLLTAHFRCEVFIVSFIAYAKSSINNVYNLWKTTQIASEIFVNKCKGYDDQILVRNNNTVIITTLFLTSFSSG